MKKDEEYCGRINAPAREVVSHDAGSWGSFSRHGYSSIGWVYFYNCVLGCGHKQLYRSRVIPSRGAEHFPAPKYLNCDTCLKEGFKPEPVIVEQPAPIVVRDEAKMLLSESGEPSTEGNGGDHETSEQCLGDDSGGFDDEYYEHPPEL